MSTHSPDYLFSPNNFTLALALLGVGLVWLLFKHRDGTAVGSTRRPDLETRRGTIFLGNLQEVAQNRHRLIEYWIDIEKDRQEPHKFLSLTIPGRPRIIHCSRPDLIEYVQKTHQSNYVKGPLFYDNVKDVLGDGIFATDGHQWLSQRKATSRIFTGNQFRGVITASLEENITKLVTIVRRHAEKGETFDLAALFFRFTLQSFGDMAFGEDVGALSTESDAIVPFAAAFDYAQGVLNDRFSDPFWKIKERFGSTGKKMKEAIDCLDAFAYQIINEREQEGLNNITAKEKTQAAKLDLLSLYMALRDENGAPMTKKALRDAVLNLIIAGRDTTAQGLAWTFFRLLQQPELIDPVRKEASETEVDYDSYKTMHQTNAVFSEGLRLHPSVPKNGWQALKDDVIPNGPIVKAGDIVFWSDWILGRDENVWGPDAKLFKPSRWIDEQGLHKKESQWVAHMFNGGPRLCLGQELAKFEACAVLSALLRNFDFDFAPGYLETTPMMDSELTPRYQPSLTLPMAAPLLVKASKRV